MSSSNNTKRPRWGSTSAGTKQQKAKMRAVLARARVHRLQRQTGDKFPQKG